MHPSAGTPVTHLSLALALSSLFSAAATGQSTWTVDDDGPADFSDLPQAASSAADGDTLLVRAGNYSAFSIDAKGLTLVAEGSVAVSSGGGFGSPPAAAIDVRNLAPGQSVAVRGFAFNGSSLSDSNRITLFEQCAGPVLLEDCTVEPGFQFGFPMVVDQCDSITLVRCEVEAGTSFLRTQFGFVEGPVTYPAVTAIQSQVAIYDSLLEGSLSTPPIEFGGAVWFAAPGEGLRLLGSTYLVVGSTLLGGDGRSPGFCTTGSDGAAALSADSWGSVPSSGTLLEATLLGGTGGAGACGSGPRADGPGLLDPAGLTTVWPGSARTSTVDSLVQEGGSATLSLTGTPGDFAIALWSRQLLAGVPLLPEPTVLHIGPPLSFAVLGSLPASGTLSASFTLPQLPTSALSVSLIVQSVLIGAPLATYEGGPSVLTILDSSL